MRTSTLVLALAAAPWALQAAPATDATTTLRVDSWRLSASAMDVLYRAAQSQDTQATRQAVAEAAAQDHLLGQYAQRQFSSEQLFVGARVGFSLDANAEAALIATLERVYQQPLAQAIGPAGPRRFVVRRHGLDAASLQASLGDGTTAKLDDRLSADAEAGLSRIAVVDYRLDESAALRTVTLRDIWRQLDVHGRQAVLRGDTGFVHHQALRMVRAAFVRQWVESQGLRAADFEALKQLMADRERRLALEETLGASGHMHGPAEELARLKAEVTAADIAAYYRDHPEPFRRTERVLARHIRCADEATAEAAYAELARGTPFAEVARRYSVAQSAMKGGALGWLEADRTRNQWLAQVAFAQPPGAASRPIREPETSGRAAGWQIVQVEERVQGMHPADSETVRFIATEAIAKQRAQERYAALKERLVRAAHISTD
ncbi:MAG TPA: peptidyl-prolyl cis-trans isomerase [Ideonella sp.]|uniref:peptidyl-prolyl cis-trans isomerase n=1 Tax=Ideonella sp. TaxID=1929293 RepID=UPI002E35ECD8|nr:peptidyl-prolyl cis-trans isomerase [Ideonella sp.]HEX5688230.1 peptidyl-prolyl cis-trans isomerase [Ideonella sp.]